MRTVLRGNSQRPLRFEFLEPRMVFSTDAYELLPPVNPLLEHNDSAAPRLDKNGFAYFFDGVDPSLLGLAPPLSMAGPSAGGPSTSLDVPVYHSNPSFPKKIYLDFDGQVVTGTPWNQSNFGSGNTPIAINATPFSTDGDLGNFSPSELATIFEVWARVSEDYAPFQVDVTTEDPGVALFQAGGQAIRAIVSTNVDANTGQPWFPAAGGVAFVGSWDWTSGTPVWIFTNNLANGFPKYVAEAAAHEVGHSLGLSHDGRVSPAEDYYGGHGSGPTGWAPIMGVGYNQALTQWSKGEYPGANNTQDDLQIISRRLAHATDDYGDTTATATQLAVGASGDFASSGLISTRTDNDAFRFATQAGSVTINVDPFDVATGKADLDVSLALVNSDGTILTTVNGSSVLNASITTTLAKGYYTLIVDGVGKTAGSDPGYSDYASLGKYFLSGTVVPNRAPVAVADVASVPAGGSVLIDVLANDTDADFDTLSLQSVGTPSAGTVAIESGKVRFTPPPTFTGPATFSYVAVDQFGATAIGLVTVNALLSTVSGRGVFYNGATGVDASTSLATDKTPLLPGQSSTFANYTNYFKGLNGLVIDIAGLPATTTNAQMLSSLQFAQWDGISAAGFTALPSAAIPTVAILSSGGIAGSTRVKITFPDNTLKNTWLRVTTVANAFTGLAGNDVFYFGNVIGEFDVDNTTTRLVVNATDTSAVRTNQSIFDNSALVTNIYDVNRDGRVDATDTGIVRTNQQIFGIVAPITAPANVPAPVPPMTPLIQLLPSNKAVDGTYSANRRVNQTLIDVSSLTPTQFVSPPISRAKIDFSYWRWAVSSVSSEVAAEECGDAEPARLRSVDEYFASACLKFLSQRLVT